MYAIDWLEYIQYIYGIIEQLGISVCKKMYTYIDGVIFSSNARQSKPFIIYIYPQPDADGRDGGGWYNLLREIETNLSVCVRVCGEKTTTTPSTNVPALRCCTWLTFTLDLTTHTYTRSAASATTVCYTTRHICDWFWLMRRTRETHERESVARTCTTSGSVQTTRPIH